MHTMQIMLVEADSGEEALDAVANHITHAEVPYPAWSDWHEIGGRWSGLFEGWEGDTKDALCYADNPILANDLIEKLVGERVAVMKGYFKTYEGEELTIQEAIDTYTPNGRDYKKTHGIWALKQVCNLLTDYWTSDTGVYDLEAHTAELNFFQERVKENPTKQYLVPVDFHF